VNRDEERRAAALRQNLRRRKEQARARTDAEARPKPASPRAGEDPPADTIASGELPERGGID
jgi:hypothetical protein